MSNIITMLKIKIRFEIIFYCVFPLSNFYFCISWYILYPIAILVSFNIQNFLSNLSTSFAEQLTPKEDKAISKKIIKIGISGREKDREEKKEKKKKI